MGNNCLKSIIFTCRYKQLMYVSKMFLNQSVKAAFSKSVAIGKCLSKMHVSSYSLCSVTFSKL